MGEKKRKIIHNKIHNLSKEDEGIDALTSNYTAETKNFVVKASKQLLMEYMLGYVQPQNPQQSLNFRFDVCAPKIYIAHTLLDKQQMNMFKLFFHFLFVQRRMFLAIKLLTSYSAKCYDVKSGHKFH